MSDLNRIEQNNAELRECIEIAESLPDAPKTSFTMQDFVDGRGLGYLYYLCSDLTDANIQWLADVDTSKCVSAKYMFYGCNQITDVPLFDTSLCSTFSNFFYGCSKLASIPNFSTGNGTDFSYMFYNCGKLASLPLLDTSKADTVANMFYYCASLESIPLLNTSQVTDFNYMFYGCKKIKVLPAIDTSQATQIAYMCHSCTLLEEFRGFNTSKVKNCRTAFYLCENLVTIELDMRNVTDTSSMFSSAYALTNVVLKNIKTNIQIGKGSSEYYGSWGLLLTVDSLVNTCYELRNTGSVKTLTVGKANLDKLATVYVRPIEITDAMRAEDDLIDDKLPFERCESTDEGATLIGDYVILKNWKLA